MTLKFLKYVTMFSVVFYFFGCNILDSDDNDDNPSDDNTPSYTTDDVLGTWTLSEESPLIETRFDDTLVFSGSDFTYTEVMTAGGETVKTWFAEGTWTLSGSKVMLTKESCLYFGVEGNCNDLDDYAEFKNGLLRYEQGDFSRE